MLNQNQNLKKKNPKEKENIFLEKTNLKNKEDFKNDEKKMISKRSPNKISNGKGVDSMDKTLELIHNPDFWGDEEKMAVESFRNENRNKLDRLERKKDEYDLDYDKGKLKKVKNKKQKKKKNINFDKLQKKVSNPYFKFKRAQNNRGNRRGRGTGRGRGNSRGRDNGRSRGNRKFGTKKKIKKD